MNNISGKVVDAQIEAPKNLFWVDRINDLFEEIRFKNWVSKEKALNGFSILIATDGNLSEDDKKSLIARLQNSIPEKEMDSFYYSFAEELSPITSTNILRYCSDDFFRSVCRLILKYRSVTTYVKPIMGWIKQSLENNWLPEEKKIFISKIFDVLPTDTRDDVLYYLMVNVSEDIQNSFLQICPAVLTERVKVFQEEIEKLGKSFMSGAQSDNERIRFDLRDNKRTYFLEWFRKNALQHENACLIAVNLVEKDWNWLDEQNSSVMYSLAMDWMIDVAKRLQSNELALNSSFSSHDAGIWLFFRHASSMVEKSKFLKVPNEKYLELSKSLTVENLNYYFNAFHGDLPGRIIKCLVNDDPRKLISWFETNLKIREDNQNERTSEKIGQLFSLVVANESIEKAITTIFDLKQNEPVLMITTYSTLSKVHRKEVLKYILKDKIDGIKTLSFWVTMCLLQPELFKSFVKDAFAKDLYRLLIELNPSLANELKDALKQSSLLSSQECQEFIDFLLPTEIDLENPAVRHDEAIKKLKRHFLTPGVPHRDRRDFVVSLYKDLGARENASAWLPKLFDQLPKETWPLIFLHFENDICRSCYFNYFEEKSNGGVYKNVNKDTPTPPKWSKNLENWIDLAATTLTQMIDNPYLKCEKDFDDSQAGWSMQKLYQATCETNTIHLVMQKFIEISPYRAIYSNDEYFFTKLFLQQS